MFLSCSKIHNMLPGQSCDCLNKNSSPDFPCSSRTTLVWLAINCQQCCPVTWSPSCQCIWPPATQRRRRATNSCKKAQRTEFYRIRILAVNQPDLNLGSKIERVFFRGGKIVAVKQTVRLSLVLDPSSELAKVWGPSWQPWWRIKPQNLNEKKREKTEWPSWGSLSKLKELRFWV